MYESNFQDKSNNKILALDSMLSSSNSGLLTCTPSPSCNNDSPLSVAIPRVTVGKSLYARWEVAFDLIVVTSGCGGIGNDVEASTKKLKRLCHEIAPID